MSQAYHKNPSELYGIHGAAGFFADQGLFIFGRWVEGEVQEAERSGSNEMFARSNAARAFARCMGDDMSKSTAGFADPWSDGAVTVVDPNTGKRKRRTTKQSGGDEILWDESAAN